MQALATVVRPAIALRSDNVRQPSRASLRLTRFTVSALGRQQQGAAPASSVVQEQQGVTQQPAAQQQRLEQARPMAATPTLAALLALWAAAPTLAALLALWAAAELPAAASELSGGPPASSYYVSLGLFLMSVPGLWSLIKRSPKAKIKRKTFEVAGPGAAEERFWAFKLEAMRTKQLQPGEQEERPLVYIPAYIPSVAGHERQRQQQLEAPPPLLPVLPAPPPPVGEAPAASPRLDADALLAEATSEALRLQVAALRSANAALQQRAASAATDTAVARREAATARREAAEAQLAAHGDKQEARQDMAAPSAAQLASLREELAAAQRQAEDAEAQLRRQADAHMREVRWLTDALDDPSREEEVALLRDDVAYLKAKLQELGGEYRQRVEVAASEARLAVRREADAQLRAAAAAAAEERQRLEAELQKVAGAAAAAAQAAGEAAAVERAQHAAELCRLSEAVATREAEQAQLLTELRGLRLAMSAPPSRAGTRQGQHSDMSAPHQLAPGWPSLAAAAAAAAAGGRAAGTAAQQRHPGMPAPGQLMEPSSDEEEGPRPQAPPPRLQQRSGGWR